MTHTAKWMLAIYLLTALAGCQRYQVIPLDDQISLAKPKQGFVAKTAGTGCLYFPACDSDSIFPRRTFTTPPAGTQCILPAAIGVGPGLFPKGVVIQEAQKVWVALAVSAKGVVAEAKVIGSTDSRFDNAAYRIATSTRFRPMTCAGKAYDSYVISPMKFSQPQRRAPGTIDAQSLYDNNQLYPNDRQLP